MEKKRTGPSLNEIESYLPEPFTEAEKELIRQWREKQPPETEPADPAGLGRELERHVLSQTRPVRRLWPLRTGIAAAVTLLMVAGYLVFRPRERLLIYANQTASPQSVRLADGTRVWVNRGAVLAYPATFEGSERVCQLREGEAFFDVVRNPARPFRVETDGFSIRVLGTSFNVRLGHSRASVTVATGKVKVQSPAIQSNTLQPDDQFVLANGRFSVRRVDAGEAAAWRSGQIYLEDVPFEELVSAVETAYGVRIIYPEHLRTQNASLHFDTSAPLTDLLDVVAGIYHVHYRQNGKEVRLK